MLFNALQCTGQTHNKDPSHPKVQLCPIENLASVNDNFDMGQKEKKKLGVLRTHTARVLPWSGEGSSEERPLEGRHEGLV